MRTALVICALLLIPATSSAQDSDGAEQLAQRAVQALGGAENFDDIRYLRFDFEVEVDGQPVYTGRHLWDRKTGRYREEWDLFGDKAQALFNVTTREGTAYRDGVEVEDSERADILEQAYYNHLNDSYWLLMPWKMTDPGVHLSVVGRETVEGTTYDILHLRFDDGVGESSGDQHWIYLNAETGKVEKTAYFLERFEKPDPSLEEASVWAWSEWLETGGVQFARERKVLRSIHDPFDTAQSRFSVVAVLDDVDDVVFEDVTVPLQGE